MAVLEYTRSPVDSTIKMDMKNVRASVDPSTLRVYRLFGSPQKAPCEALQWFSLPKQARARPKSLPDGRVARWLDGLDGHFG